jgi:hypothetical protein
VADVGEYQPTDPPSDFIVYSDHVSSRRDPRPVGTGLKRQE